MSDSELATTTPILLDDGCPMPIIFAREARLIAA